jgi:hypothetical protein
MTAMNKNDVEALAAAFAGLTTTWNRLQEVRPALAGLAALPEGTEPPADLMRASVAHAIAAGAFSGLLHKIFYPREPAPTKVELTDSAAESGS